MAEDLAKLVVKLEAQTAQYQRKLDAADKRLGRFQKSQTDALSKVKGSFVGVTGAVVGLVSAGAGLSKLVRSARSFDVINASLVTATGSADKAKIAFSAIQDFAATTPFQLDEVADAFIKMTNLGLDPSEAALTSYGNTASAMGKSLNQMIEAVADAATGEFERLKEFGIKASSEGDRVKFTFRGMTTEIGKNAREIEDYLKGIGDIEFAGAMAARADTLDGALSNLEDSFNALFTTASKDGGADKLVGSVRQLSELLQDPKTIQAAQSLANILASGFSGAVTAINNTSFAIDILLGKTNTLGSIQFEIERLEAVIKRLSSKPRNGDEYVITELTAQLDELIKKRDELLNPSVSTVKPEDALGSVSAAPIDRTLTGDPNLKGGAKAVAALDKDLAAFDDYLKSKERMVVESLKTETELVMDSYNERMEIILASTRFTEEQKKELTIRLNDETLQEVTVSAKKVQDDIQANAETQAEAFDRIFGAGALTQLFSDLDNIEDRFKSLLANIAAQALASGIMSMFNGGSFGSGVGGFFGGLFGGGKASGGPVSSGTTYLVGEQGPELFTPNVSGGIIPNHQMSGTQVTINLPNIRDTDTFRRSQGQIASEMAKEVRRAGRNF